MEAKQGKKEYLKGQEEQNLEEYPMQGEVKQ
jgi:hypothetical protein